MIFRQITYGPGGCASYFLGCVKYRVAAVVDPLADVGVEEYLMEAADRGLAITHVIDTHVHADHVSIGRELAEGVGAVYCLGAAARPLVQYDFHPLADGDVVAIGNVELQAIHTPGHTPESLCLLVTDRSRGDRPWFLLTGDTLFVGDVGRPDLLVGDRALDVWETRERAERLHASIRGRLLHLPDTVEVYPGHYGGSACGGVNMSGKPISTIGFERAMNPALQHDAAEDFAEFVLSTLKPQPQGFQQIKRRNLGLEEESAGARHDA